MDGGSAGYKNGFFRNMLTADKDANVRFLDILNAMLGTALTIENTSIEDVSLDAVSLLNT